MRVIQFEHSFRNYPFALLGSGGTITGLHFDSCDNILVQLVGAKYVRLYDRGQTPFLYRKPSATESHGGRHSSKLSPDAQGNSSAVGRHVEAADALSKWPLWGMARYNEAVLGPGDALYIPSGVWHYARALKKQPSLSVNLWFCDCILPR